MTRPSLWQCVRAARRERLDAERRQALAKAEAEARRVSRLRAALFLAICAAVVLAMPAGVIYATAWAIGHGDWAMLAKIWGLIVPGLMVARWVEQRR